MKRLFAALVLGFALAIAAASPGMAQGVPGATVEDEWGPQDRGLPGTWLIAIDFPGIPTFRYLMTVDPDGTVNQPLPDHFSFYADQGANDTRSACVGPWKRTGARTYQMTVYCLESQDMGGFLDRGRFNLTLSKDGMTLSDPAFKWEWWLGGMSDGTYLGYGIGSFAAQRLPNVPKD